MKYREKALKALGSSSLTPKQRQEAIDLLDEMLQPAGVLVSYEQRGMVSVSEIGNVSVFEINLDTTDQDDEELAEGLDHMRTMKDKVLETFEADSAQEAIEKIEDGICMLEKDLKLYPLS